jgi:hypothetical protein
MASPLPSTENRRALFGLGALLFWLYATDMGALLVSMSRTRSRSCEERKEKKTVLTRLGSCPPFAPKYSSRPVCRSMYRRRNT